MRPHGQTKLGFFPLPVAEAKRLKTWLAFPERFSALDPCVGDGVAFAHLLREVTAHRYGIEIDANRAEQAKALGIETLQANAMDVPCQPEAVSLLYLNPPYDWESGESNNQRLEFVFLEHTYRWLKAGGVLLLVIPQLRLAKCARLLSEHFTDLRLFRLTEAASVQYKQIAVLATRRTRHVRLADAALLDEVRYLEALATKTELEPLGDTTDVRYEVPASEPAVLTNMGIPLDEVEDLLLESAAYRQAGRVLLPKMNDVKGPAAHTPARWACRPALYRRNAQRRIWRRRGPPYCPLAFCEVHRPLGGRGRRRNQDPA